MDLRRRVRDRIEMDPAGRSEVVRHWLESEVDQDDSSLDPEAIDDEAELVSALVDRTPIAARTFRPPRLDWYHLNLSPGQLGDLRVVEGPPDEEWRRVAPDGMLASAAYRLFEADEPERIDRNVSHDLLEVLDLADDITASGPPEDLILVQDRPDELPWIADGNHTAAAQQLSVLRGDGYVGQAAYLGVRRTGETERP
ncbi:hypothetical protein [Halostella sp. PRR32]|uniref:hypothetical protein n=1 Tax=Halostella sp. PRR32 TaxID=3098147 RepID=UPI00110D3721|nr:hypothetical protein [Halostella sp. PRR32]